MAINMYNVLQFIDIEANLAFTLINFNLELKTLWCESFSGDYVDLMLYNN